MTAPLHGIGRPGRKRIRRARAVKTGVKIGGARGAAASRNRRVRAAPSDEGASEENRQEAASELPAKGKLDIVA